MILIDDMNIDLDCKWKSAVFYDDFTSLENWENNNRRYSGRNVMKADR